jgi:hypothetical protein
VPDRHAAARWRRLARRRAHQPERPRCAGGRHHGIRQRGEGRRGTESRCVRLSGKAGGTEQLRW